MNLLAYIVPIIYCCSDHSFFWKLQSMNTDRTCTCVKYFMFRVAMPTGTGECRHVIYEKVEVKI
jgi:hypothetical protein